jgi:hypothetical protein
MQSSYDIMLLFGRIVFEGKDINEMIMNGISQDEIERIISSNTFRDIEAQLKMNMWKKL